MLERQLRLDLDHALDCQKTRDALDSVRRRERVFERYPTLDDLRDLFRISDHRYDDKDAVLIALLEEARRDDAIFPVIQDLFWHSLVDIYRGRRRTLVDAEERWSRLIWEFYRVVRTHHLVRRPTKIFANIHLDTMKAMCRWDAAEARERGALAELAVLRSAGLSPDDLDSTIHTNEVEMVLDDLVLLSIVSDIQRDLILETLVHRRMNQREWAESRGISYNTVRSLRSRAESAIRQHFDGSSRPGARRDCGSSRRRKT